MMITMAMNWANTLIRMSLLDQVRAVSPPLPEGVEPQAQDHKDDADSDGDQKLAHGRFLRPPAVERQARIAHDG
jgi:hypothetical protein